MEEWNSCMIEGKLKTGKILVLLFNVGPETFGNLSDICQKSVRKLSVTKMCQKTVLNVSEFCQKTVRCKYLSEIYQKRFGNASEMCPISKIRQKTVTSFCQKTVRSMSSDLILTHLYLFGDTLGVW